MTTYANLTDEQRKRIIDHFAAMDGTNGRVTILKRAADLAGA